MNLGLMQLQGKHSEIYVQLKKKLIKMLAAVEAYIDFDADETNQVGEIMQPVRA
jgi:tRNA U34 5-carboxymethylaminomethyl modifying GTPase MnmE/TrmE